MQQPLAGWEEPAGGEDAAAAAGLEGGVAAAAGVAGGVALAAAAAESTGGVAAPVAEVPPPGACI